MVLLRPLFPYSWSFPSWDLRRVLNCILIPLIELEDSSNVEVDEGFISLASLFGISAYLSFGCVLSCFSHVWLYATLWIVACQAPLSMGLSRQEYWNGLPCTAPGDLPTQGWNPGLPHLLHCRWILYDQTTRKPPNQQCVCPVLSHSVVSDSLQPHEL